MEYRMYDVEPEYLNKWQKSLDLLAQLFDVPAALIMRVHSKEIEVLLASNSEGNPYKSGEMAELDTGLYCEEVMRTHNQLLVPNALEDEVWKDNPDVPLNMIAYLGQPLILPNGEIFGTICVLDSKTRFFTETNQKLLLEFKVIIETDFALNRRYLKQVAESETRLRLYFDSAPYTMMLLDKDFKVEDINRHGRIIVQRSRQEVKGHLGGPVLSCIHSYTSQGCGKSPHCYECSIRNSFEKTIQSGESIVDEEGSLIVYDQNLNQAIFYFLISSTQVVTNNDSHVLVTLHDISKRKQIEQALRESENRFSQMFEHMGSGVAIYEPVDDGKDFVFRGLNLAAEKITNTLRDEVIGRRLLDIFPYMDKSVLLTSLQRVYQSGQDEHIPPFYYEDSIRKGWRENRIFKLPSGEIVSIFDDVTERMQTERRLQQAQKVEAVGTLSGGIAHDFNNILSALLGYAEMAREDSPSGSSTAQYLEQVIKSGNRAKDLVKQILSFARQQDSECISFVPASLVKETMEMLRPTIPSTIEIIENVDPQTRSVFADPNQFIQILMNLCTNAYQALEETGGKITVSLKETSLKEEELLHEPDIEAGSFVKLSVSDTGIGMSAETMDKIFDPFFTTKEVGKGTGMGLSIVHGIVNNYGGLTTLESEVGEGTTFHVFLPVERNTTSTEIKVLYETQSPVGKERILFVDDEETLATMGKHMLERLGYIVTVSTSSYEALETFQNQPDQFDLIITDQTMPEMTGANMAEKMLLIRSDIPIILCTGYSSIMPKEKAISMGIREYMSKPVSKNDLALSIRKVLDAS